MIKATTRQTVATRQAPMVPTGNVYRKRHVPYRTYLKMDDGVVRLDPPECVGIFIARPEHGCVDDLGPLMFEKKATLLGHMCGHKVEIILEREGTRDWEPTFGVYVDGVVKYPCLYKPQARCAFFFVLDELRNNPASPLHL